MMEEEVILRAKICLVGESAVGKTSLIRRYVLDQFSDEYLSTFGTKVMKKEMHYKLRDSQGINLLMTIWDIIGEKELLTVVKESYFHGAGGLMAVCDLTREDTFQALSHWIAAANKVVGNIPIIITANKLDLISTGELNDITQSLESFAGDYNANLVLTSAKSGENVDLAFKRIGENVIGDAMDKVERDNPF